MDQKTPIQFEELPVPAACTAECRRQKHSRKRRAFRAFGLSALLLWLGARYLRFASPMVFRDPGSPWPFPSDVTVDHCAEWSDPVETEGAEHSLYSADASLELPASADALFLISRSLHHRGGVFSTGNVNYLQSDEVTDAVKVDITAFFWREEHLAASKACLLRRGGDQTGVGIFTNWDEKRRREEHERLRLEVTVAFPRTEDNSALAINNFSSDLEIFGQTLADLSNVNFKTLSLKAALSAIRAESLFAGNATIRTSIGPIRIQSLIGETAVIGTSLGAIEGTFNSSKSLTLSTSNGAIIVEVNLFNNDEDDAAKLKLLTSNGRIESRINLESENSGSAFNITARTSHGPIDLEVVAAPLASNVTLGATTSLGSLSAKLPTTFEGMFDASTSLSSVEVKFDENAEDPSGKGRKRSLDHGKVGKASSHGHVSWSEEGKTRGSVTARSSLGPVSLEF
ncbi:hypothetical protein C8F04DRAFT_1089081 [Mycena alexandri]|uniref:DUF7330 domain-containing protein n=1 Tax=Mycena alexandri TaxID=1745969 RepID=A0AAD6T396_9AGAR|nr:hypothetical protein C8F04DRAFT_1089081 [Mycena alexandri]